MLTLGSKLNRLYSLYFPFMTGFCEISILFNKSNSFIGFNVDQTNYIKSRNNELKCYIFNDLSKSAFATSFLDIRNFRSKNLDIQQQFNNILPEYKDKIHYETNETCKLSKITTSKGVLESCLYTYVFRLTDYGNDFIYVLAERQHIDVAMDRKIVRTAAIQLSSNDCNEDLEKYIFDTSFFKQVVNEDHFDYVGMVIFRIVNEESNKEKFIHIYNSHNGYYSHGFEFVDNEKMVQRGDL
jgi:hypothetical protein